MAATARRVRRGGRYAVAGAIGGTTSEIDVRTVYLEDLTLLGCTFQPDEVFDDLVEYIHADEFRPPVAATYPLSDIATAQQELLAKKHVGKLAAPDARRLLQMADM